ncbi:CBS domain-containing protein [Phenylobacterium sp.]|jgi:CBS domain-containing protein|uniref:CBS domain-containing protein n=1 Tax=Phenylobacterium sp. TaxID=1871053 RepID=UPI002E3480C1|nr:CBS domain-containing protein [Phenylobacterium sp.]HEX2559178.1 CBS domain-containing protein [Phenylobacterium sp.]
MKVSDVMTRDVQVASPTDTVADVARRMSEIDSGVMPIQQGGQIVGLITDRDIVIRVVGEGRDNEIPVSEVMTSPVETCLASESLKTATKRMADLQMRRLVIVDDQGSLAGILSLGDVAREASARALGHTLEEISEDGAR